MNFTIGIARAGKPNTFFGYGPHPRMSRYSRMVKVSMQT